MSTIVRCPHALAASLGRTRPAYRRSSWRPCVKPQPPCGNPGNCSILWVYYISARALRPAVGRTRDRRTVAQSAEPDPGTGGAKAGGCATRAAPDCFPGSARPHMESWQGATERLLIRYEMEPARAHSVAGGVLIA